jgi:hypothetical protein
MIAALWYAPLCLLMPRAVAAPRNTNPRPFALCKLHWRTRDVFGNHAAVEYAILSSAGFLPPVLEVRPKSST